MTVIQRLLSSSLFGQFLEVVPITALVGVVYAASRARRVKRSGAPIAWGHETARLFFVCYLTGLVNLVLVPNNFWTYVWFYVRNGYPGGELRLFSGGANFVPTLYRCLTGELELGPWVREMLIGNFLMFVPMGVLLPLAVKKVAGRTILLAAIAIPAVVETLQPIVGRSFDVDDLICNFLGILLGYLLVSAVRSAIRRREGASRETRG